MTNRIESFRSALLEGRQQTGLFSKYTEPEIAETLAQSRLDFLILDAEHNSFSRSEISRYVYAAQARNMPVLVRLSDGAPSGIQHAITVGAAGVVIPHLASKEEVQEAVEFTRGLAIERAYAGMGRAAELRVPSWADFRARTEKRIVFIAQVDEPPGVAACEDIAGVAGVDALFIGRLGLSLAMKADSPDDPRVDAALIRVCQAGQANQRRVGMHLGDAAQAAAWRARGVSMFVVGNDYSLLHAAANQAADKFSAKA